MRFAVAIFARTPGYSAAKSRLAKEIGVAAAEQLYFHSLSCCGELANNLVELGIDVCWAIAEEEALKDRYWQTTQIPTMISGQGDLLGDRLAYVHAQLLEVADVGILLGSDSPQLTVKDIEQIWASEEIMLPQIGPAYDGGFYLFADSNNYTRNQWNKVEYSTATTLAQLEKSLKLKPAYLSMQPDFDDCQSLAQVVVAMPAKPTQEQIKFRELALEVLEPSMLEHARKQA